jgi:hypothetical protein
MDLISLCPLPVAQLRWIDRYGRQVLTFVCRATLDLLPVASRLSEQQEPPSELDNHWDDDPSRSLYAPTDLAPLKARADVMLVGSAFAPRGEAVRSLRTRLVVGEIDKSIDVYGERVWGQDGGLREGQRFAKMPLRWERAAGGPRTANPVGVHSETADAYGQIPVPNLQPPGLDLKGSGDFIQPIGYGPLAAGWPDRRDKLRIPVTAFLGTEWAQQPLPEEVDPRFFNAAPRDQQVGVLRENERIVLENLHPEHPRLVTSLPGIRPRAFVETGTAPPRELSMVCDTLWINTDSALCTLTWRGQLALEGEGGRIFIALEEPGQRLTWDDIERLRRHLGVAPDVVRAFAATPSTPSTPPPAPPAPSPDLRARFDALPFAKSDGPPSSRTSTELRSFAAPTPAPRRGALTMDGRSLQQGLQGLDASPSWLTSQSARAASPDAAIPSVPRPSQAPPSLGVPRPAPAAPTFGTPHPPPSAPVIQPSLQPMPEPSWAPAPPPPPSVVPPPPPVLFSAPALALGASLPPLQSLAATPPPAAVAPSPPLPAAPSTGLRARPMSDAQRPASASNSALEASNAAAQLQDRPAPRPAAPLRNEAIAASPRQSPSECVDLIWFDPEALERARAIPQLRALFAAEKKKGAEAWLDDGSAGPTTPEQRDRVAALRALTRGRSLDDADLTPAMAGAVTSEGAFTAPIAVIAGELHFRFDELSTLKATVAAFAPLTAADKKLKELSDSAGELLRSTWATSGAGVAEAMTMRLREAFAQQSRSLPPNYLERTVDRTLLEQRLYQKRAVLGGEMIRALLFAGGGSTPVPTYLPESIGRLLPLFPSFRACVLASVVATQDQSEAHPAALHVIAIGRVMPTPGRAPAAQAR